MASQCAGSYPEAWPSKEHGRLKNTRTGAKAAWRTLPILPRDSTEATSLVETPRRRRPEIGRMSDTRELLQKITSLRLRLDQAQGLGQEALTTGPQAATAALDDKVQRGNWHHALLDGALRPFEKSGPAPLPHRLTYRAAKVVHAARDLLAQLRALAEDPLLARGDDDPLAHMHRETANIIDAVLRTVQTLPSAPSVQMRLCAGLEAILDVVAQRLGAIKSAIRQRGLETGRIDRLADVLRRLASGQAVSITPLHELATEIFDEARQSLPLRFPTASGDDPARHAAAHGITVAAVLARVVIGETAWLSRELDGICAALVHDVGMVRLPAEILGQAGPLTDEQRRLVERHPLAGAQALVKLWPGGGWPIEAAADHHERSDGCGYPRGKRDLQLSDEVKLLAVCDVYAALASARPHRPAREPRTALADTLLLAEQGKLDAKVAERLLALSFYPPGCVVQLDDGSVAVVLAPQAGAKALSQPSKPFVSVIQDALGQAPALPRLIDLAESERGIVRGLKSAERRAALGTLYPELV
jgi:hypothetical protein